MRLASFHAAGKDRVGVHLQSDSAPAGSGAPADGVLEGALVDLLEAAAAAGVAPARAAVLADMVTLIEAAEAGRALVEQVRAHALANPRSVPHYDAAQVRWHAPVRRPSKIVCLALNNSANTDRIL